jgi:hypothetical protein
MDQYLQTLERMKDMPIVRFFSQFFSQPRLSPLVDHFRNALALKTPGSLAKELFFWAVVLALVTFAVDQAFYWTKPGQVERAKDTWTGISLRLSSFGRGVKGIASRAKGPGRRGEPVGRR